MCGPHGILDALEPERNIHVSMSTISPALVRALAERHAERNQSFLSAPVLGRPSAAEQGKLFVLAAGNADLIEALRPAFDALGQRTFVIGDAPESANLVKLSCNALIGTMLEAVGETLALVSKAGIAPKAYIDVLMATALNSPVYAPYGESILQRHFEPEFRVPLALKDIELSLDAGNDLAVPLPLLSLLRDHLIAAIAAGDGELTGPRSRSSRSAKPGSSIDGRSTTFSMRDGRHRGQGRVAVCGQVSGYDSDTPAPGPLSRRANVTSTKGT